DMTQPDPNPVLPSQGRGETSQGVSNHKGVPDLVLRTVAGHQFGQLAEVGIDGKRYLPVTRSLHVEKITVPVAFDIACNPFGKIVGNLLTDVQKPCHQAPLSMTVFNRFRGPSKSFCAYTAKSPCLMSIPSMPQRARMMPYQRLST